MNHGETTKFLTPLNTNNYSMECTQSIIPILWKFLDRCKKCSISMNVVTVDNELIISIIDRKKIKRFKNRNSENLLADLRSYLKVT